MSDILLERIAVALEKIAANGGGGHVANQSNASGAQVQPPIVATPATAITADSLLQLVQPLVQDEGTKAKVKEVLTKYNLNRLGEAQESQYPALYAEFQAIGGVAGAAAPAPASEDLI